MPNPLTARLQAVPETGRFQDPDWFVWGGSITAGPDGKYYLLYASWPRRFLHGAWLTHSEVAARLKRAGLHVLKVDNRKPKDGSLQIFRISLPDY